MMSQQFQQPEPPNNFKTLMKDVGWPTIVGIIVFVATIWIGKIQIINFNWLMLILGIIMFVITIFFVWYSRRTREKLQSKHHDDLAALKKEFRAFQDNYRDMVNQEFNRLNEWAINYSQANAKEQKERLEELKKQLTEQIGDVNTSLTTSIKNNYTHFADWTTAHANAHREEQKLYKHQLKALEEKLTDKQVSESNN